MMKIVVEMIMCLWCVKGMFSCLSEIDDYGQCSSISQMEHYLSAVYVDLESS